MSLDRFPRVVPLVAIAAAAIFLVLFVYGYPRLFPQIEASHPDHFETYVADALARGDSKTALRFAARVSQRRPKDPAAQTVHGQVLLKCGRAEEGVAQLEKAVSLSEDLLPPYRGTRRPFYFAAARLALGEYHLGEGRPADAVVQFELARPYAALTGEQHKGYHEALYQAYSQRGLWARALEFREPADGELDAVKPESLVLLARVCEGNQNWPLAERVAHRILSQDASEANYLFGRVKLARGQYAEAAAHLEKPAAEGRINAAFFLGDAYQKAGDAEKAVVAYKSAPAGDPYRPFALFNAMALLKNVPEEHAELLRQLESEIEVLRRLKPLVANDAYARLAPLAFTFAPLYFEAGARFPVLILWKDPKASLAAERAPALSVLEDSMTLRQGADLILQLQWVENEVNWAGVDLAADYPGEAPGWIDTARDWFGLRTDYAAEAVHEADDAHLCINKMTWFYSVPVRVRQRTGYLAAGRVRAPGGKAGLRWQAIREDERVIAEEAVKSPATDAWAWQSAFFPSQLSYDRLRLQLEVLPRSVPAAFDDVMLLALSEPILSESPPVVAGTTDE